MNEILAFPELDVSAKKVAPVELSVEELMMESAMDSVGVSSDKSEEAKRELEEYIAIMLEKEKEDAFEAVRYAIYRVVPQVMTYREAVLEETADQFNMVNELNNDMLDMQGKFAASGDLTQLNADKIQGVENAYAYFQKAGMNAEKVRQMMEDGVLPHGIGTSMLENLEEITTSYQNETGDTSEYGPATTLFNGMVGIDTWAMADYDTSSPYMYHKTPEADEFDAWQRDRSTAFLIDEGSAPYASSLNDNNTVIQSSLNGYSKEVEAEFKFNIEEYGQYLSLSSQLYDSGVKSVQVHVKEQRA